MFSEPASEYIRTVNTAAPDFHNKCCTDRKDPRTHPLNKFPYIHRQGRLHPNDIPSPHLPLVLQKVPPLPEEGC